MQAIFVVIGHNMDFKNIAWDQVESRPSFVGLKPEQQETVRQKWFDDNVAGRQSFAALPPDKQQIVRNNWFQPQKDAAPGMGGGEIAQNTGNGERDKSTLGDYGRSLAAGLDKFGQLLGRGLDVAGLDTAGQYVENLYKEREQQARAGQSDAYKAAQQKTFLSDKEGETFGEAWKSPHKIAGTVLESIPSMIAGGGAGFAVAKGLMGLGVSSGLAGILGGATGEGGVAAAESSKQAYDTVMGADDAAIQKTPEYLRALETVDPALDFAEQHRLAKEALAKDAALTTAAIVGGATAVLGAPSGHALGRIMAGEAGEAFIRTIAKQGAAEALQEAPQSAVEQIQQNRVTQQYIDPDKNIFEGAAEAAVTGAVTGAVMGAGLGGAAHGGNLTETTVEMGEPTQTGQPNREAMPEPRPGPVAADEGQGLALPIQGENQDVVAGLTPATVVEGENADVESTGEPGGVGTVLGAGAGLTGEPGTAAGEVAEAQLAEPAGGEAPQAEAVQETEGVQTAAAQAVKDSLTTEDVQAVFPNQSVTETADGYAVAFRKGAPAVTIRNVERIGVDDAAFQVGYGRKVPESVKRMGASGSYQDGVIRISRIGDRWTLGHEAFHHLAASKMLSDKDLRAINRAIDPKGQATEEQMANFVQDALADREAYRGKGMVAKTIQRIQDIIDGFVNLFDRTGLGVVRDMESGRAFDAVPGRAGVNPALTPQPVGETTQEAASTPVGAGLTPAPVQYAVPRELGDLFGASKPVGVIEKTRETINDWRENWRTRAFDRLNPLKELGDDAYQLQRLTEGTHGIIESFFDHGKLRWDGKVLTTDTQKQGFVPWLDSKGEDGKKLLYWLSARRAEQLEAEGRENWLTPENRARIDAYVGDAADPKWQAMAAEFTEFNKSVLDVAERAGLISKEGREGWERDIYIPFYRVFEDPETREEALRGPKAGKKTIDAQIRRLKGAEAKIGDPLENILKNWTHLIEQSVQNMARAEAFEAAEARGLAEEIPKSEVLNFRKSDDGKMTFVTKKDDTDVLAFQEDGERKYFRVKDPELYNAMLNTRPNAADNFILKLFGGAKRVLTYGATFGPGFRVANMIRDAMHTAIISKSFNPFIDSLRGAAKAWAQDEDYVKLMAAGGGFGGSYTKAGDPGATARYVERIIDREGPGAVKRVLNTPKKLLDFWERVGAASEQAARVSLYQRRREGGVGNQAAAFEARDLLDFAMGGSSGAVRYLAQTVPFLNARMQGLYKLGRAAKESPKSFAVKGGLLALASLGLWAHNRDDERYQALEDWEKRAYYHFWVGEDHMRIPKPFEVGALFSSLFEAAGDTMVGDEDFEYFVNFLKHTAVDTFALNPVPQAMMPALETYFNKSFFSGREIEGMALQRLRPGERADARTSETLRRIGRATNISPKKMEALIKGYTATIGQFALGLSDMVIEQAARDMPEKPAARISQYPMIGRFMRGSVPGSTKYGTRFYEAFKDINELTATVNELRKSGDIEAARRLYQDRVQEDAV
jgi:hypothetical protein